MKDIIVTTPKGEMANAAKEAADCLAAGSGFYFRTLGTIPKHFDIGGKVWYVENGYIRGYAFCSHIERDGATCATTGRHWLGAVRIIMAADSWKWIKPIPMKGFQGWRYFIAPADMEIAGDWKAPKP